MSTRLSLTVAALLLSFSFSFSGAISLAQEKGAGHGREGAIASETGRLRDEVRQLQDVNAMLVENLAACAEENQELSDRLAGTTPPERASPRQLDLIESIRRALSVPSGLEFLSILNEDQLQALLTAVRGRLK